MANEELKELVNRCLRKDQQAMRELVDLYKSRVYGLCYRMLAHQQDAEDAAQETFVRVLRSLDRWDPDRDFEPWLLAIAGNRCRTALSRRAKRTMQPLVAPIPTDETGMEMAAGGLAEEIQLALSRLREEYRLAFLYFHEHEMSYAEIAEALRCPLGTVKTWVHRARKEIIGFLRQRGVLEESAHAAKLA